MASKVQPPQFVKAKKAAPAPAKGSGDSVTTGDVTLLKNILAENNIPAPKAQKIVKAFRAGNS